MRKTEVKAYRNNRASSLRQLADILERQRIIDDPSPLHSAAAQCASPPYTRGNTAEEYWEYQVTNLTFKKLGAEHLSAAKPKGATDIKLELSVDLQGVCRTEYRTESPFVRLGVDIVVRGKSLSGSDISSAWHLDRHLGEHTEMAHPEYHFQYGGRNMAHLSNYGLHLLLESPRLTHPPLDGVLAIDFILSNYFGKEWQILRSENDQYRNLLQQAQKWFWVPYALSLVKMCPANSPTSNWDVKSILPQLILK